MGKSIVVSATPERLSIAQKQMQGKDRDTIFSLPFIRGLVEKDEGDVISSNIASQRVAYRVGYYPAFVTDWRCDF
ncbi:hypothetical protein ABU162_28570 [Paenibacillus thiaminolyticus]|uniref:hypothetical protein n=1 Tax=Paenibacillus thiaminolyticus TaxID=49283 RepID=UPI0035A6928D